MPGVNCCFYKFCVNLYYYHLNIANPSLALRGFCRASKYPLWLLIAAFAGVYIASIGEGNPACDNGSVNPRLYNDNQSYSPEEHISKVFSYRIMEKFIISVI